MVMALGTAAEARKLTYSSSSAPCVPPSVKLECHDRKSQGIGILLYGSHQARNLADTTETGYEL